MNKEQEELFSKLAPLAKKVATNVISGMSNIDAYLKAGGKAKTKATQESCVSEILSNPKVKAFIDSMQEEAVNDAVMSRQEMMERLSALSRTNMSDLIEWRTQSVTGDEGEEAEQSIWSIKESAESDPITMASIAEVTAGRDGFKIKQHSPLAAMKQLSDLAGYNAASKVDHQSSDGSMSPIQLTPEQAAEARAKMLEQDDC